MPLTDGDRVQRRGVPGTVLGAEFEGRTYVRLDTGVACTFPTAELTPLAASGESKAWPPGGIETK